MRKTKNLTYSILFIVLFLLFITTIAMFVSAGVEVMFHPILAHKIITGGKGGDGGVPCNGIFYAAGGPDRRGMCTAACGAPEECDGTHPGGSGAGCAIGQICDESCTCVWADKDLDGYPTTLCGEDSGKSGWLNLGEAEVIDGETHEWVLNYPKNANAFRIMQTEGLTDIKIYSVEVYNEEDNIEKTYDYTQNELGYFNLSEKTELSENLTGEVTEEETEEETEEDWIKVKKIAIEWDNAESDLSEPNKARIELFVKSLSLPCDCDDYNPYIHPGAEELCDNADNDCDEQIDEGEICKKYIYLCKSDEFEGDDEDMSAGSCTGGEWCSGEALGEKGSCSYENIEGGELGRNEFYAYVCDADGCDKFTEGRFMACGLGWDCISICDPGECKYETKEFCSGLGMWQTEGWCQSDCGLSDSTCANCEHGACDTYTGKWCKTGYWTDENYCDCNICGSKDSSCTTGCSCTSGSCDTANEGYCDEGFWDSDNYCYPFCCMEDYDCSEVCETCQQGTCDTKNNMYCLGGIWTSDNYCSNDRCGRYDSDCGITGSCPDGVCDTSEKKYCANGVWKGLLYPEPYCNPSYCKSQDPSCPCDENWDCSGGWSNDCDGVYDTRTCAGWEDLNSCVGATAPDDAQYCYVDFPCTSDDDRDGDGYPARACYDSANDMILEELDCDDNDNSRYPGANEECNEKDDDCDDSIDEGCSCTTEGVIQVCGKNQGVCRQGIQTCTGGYWSVCGGLDYVGPSDEVCDSLDNNCDGYIDEDCDCTEGNTQDCGTDLGICSKGWQACYNGKFGSVCNNEIKGTTEICNNDLDDDCDGYIDSYDSSCPPPCIENWYCSGGWGNDCDGVYDTQTCSEWEDLNNCGTIEDKPADTRDCYVDFPCTSDDDRDGDGYPARACYDAVSDVVIDEPNLDCNDNDPNINYDMTEVCNGKDDNCDDSIDEGCPCQPGDTPQACGKNQGVCKQGIQTCIDGYWSICGGSGYVGPQEEECDDGEDNNCDGFIDENCNCIEGAIQECGTDLGECSKGWQACSQGSFGSVCNNETVGTTEICNNDVDDDCDGDVDGEDTHCQISIHVIVGPVSCSNRKQDGDEEGVDCGGSCPRSCDQQPPACDYGKIEDKCVCGKVAYRTGYCCNGKYSITSCIESPKDSDSDGCLDDKELQMGTDPYSSDTDLDGLLDCDEGEASPLCNEDGICDSERNYPETLQNCSDCEEKVRIGFLTWILLILIILALLGIGLYLYAKSKGKKLSDFIKIKEKKKKEEKPLFPSYVREVSRPEVAAKPTKRDIAQLRTFVNSALKKGYTKLQIRQSAEKAGWTKQEIDEAMKKKKSKYSLFK